MRTVEGETAVRFIKAVGELIRLKGSLADDSARVTYMFSYAVPGLIEAEMLAATTRDEDLDMIHLEFELGREADGPVNIKLSEDRNGKILAWSECDLWADRDTRIVLIVPKGQDFGFGSDGAALVRITDLDTGLDRALGIARARELLAAQVEGGRTPQRH